MKTAKAGDWVRDEYGQTLFCVGLFSDTNAAIFIKEDVFWERWSQQTPTYLHPGEYTILESYKPKGNATKTVWHPVSEPPQEPRDATNKWVWAIGAHRGTKIPVLWHEVHPYFHSHWTEMVVPEGPEAEDG